MKREIKRLSEILYTKNTIIKTITHNGDAFVIGRSGSGKTTVAMLKLFITDVLFKLRYKLDNSKQNELIYSYKQIFNLQLNASDYALQLRTLFITASPLLAWRIKKYYDQLVLNIQDHINQKRSAGQQKQNNGKEQDDDESNLEILNFIKEDELAQLNESEEINDQEIEEYEKEMGTFSKLSEIKRYPTFMTLRKLLMILDASLYKPFFPQNEKQNKPAQWHNEQFGVFLFPSDSNLEQDILKEKQIQQIDEENVIKLNNQTEVNLDVFIDFFWPKIVNSLSRQCLEIRSFDPTLVWTEIYTKIKGHETSFEYPNKYINLENYLYYNRKNQKFCQGKKTCFVIFSIIFLIKVYHQTLGENHSKLLYRAFQLYEKLKKKYNYYDLLDIVNHINYEISSGLDIIDSVHYLIIDEFQDLPKAVLILLDKVTDYSLFCCGDTAQNIVKGVGLKLFDLQNCLRSSKPIQKQKVRNIETFKLSYNFRSTNSILQLANSVIVMSIQT